MKKYFFTLLFTIILLVQTTGQANFSLREESPVSEERITQYLKEQVSIGPKIPGTQGSREFGRWITNLVNASSLWQISEKKFTYKGTEIVNYLITSRGVDFPEFLVGAHYDTRARATQENPSIPVIGANDGASGVAGVVELMNLLSNYNSSEIGFVLFDAEDQGYDGKGYGMDGWEWIVGSTGFVDSMTAEQKSKLKGFILFDMIGNPDLTLRYEGSSTRDMREAIWTEAGELGYEEVFLKETGVTLIDDHRPFLDAGIPAVDIIDFSGYAQWHTTRDDLEHVSATSVAVVVDVTFSYLVSRFSLVTTTEVTIPTLPFTPSTQSTTPVLLLPLITGGILLGLSKRLKLIR